MDTRTKIISPEDASERLRGQPAQWVAGHFDPLLAEHIRFLREHAAPNQLLVVEIRNPAHPLLAARARAELVAAVAQVDYVVLKNDGSGPEAAADAPITERFIEDVRRRHGPQGTA